MPFSRFHFKVNAKNEQALMALNKPGATETKIVTPEVFKLKSDENYIYKFLYVKPMRNMNDLFERIKKLVFDTDEQHNLQFLSLESLVG